MLQNCSYQLDSSSGRQVQEHISTYRKITVYSQCLCATELSAIVLYSRYTVMMNSHA